VQCVATKSETSRCILAMPGKRPRSEVLLTADVLQIAAWEVRREGTTVARSSHSAFGVEHTAKDRSLSKFQAEMNIEGQPVVLGKFITPEEAALTYAWKLGPDASAIVVGGAEAEAEAEAAAETAETDEATAETAAEKMRGTPAELDPEMADKEVWGEQRRAGSDDNPERTTAEHAAAAEVDGFKAVRPCRAASRFRDVLATESGTGLYKVIGEGVESKLGTEEEATPDCARKEGAATSSARVSVEDVKEMSLGVLQEMSRGGLQEMSREDLQVMSQGDLQEMSREDLQEMSGDEALSLAAEEGLTLVRTPNQTGFKYVVCQAGRFYVTWCSCGFDRESAVEGLWRTSYSNAEAAALALARRLGVAASARWSEQERNTIICRLQAEKAAKAKGKKAAAEAKKLEAEAKKAALAEMKRVAVESKKAASAARKKAAAEAKRAEKTASRESFGVFEQEAAVAREHLSEHHRLAAERQKYLLREAAARQSMKEKRHHEQSEKQHRDAVGAGPSVWCSPSAVGMDGEFSRQRIDTLIKQVLDNKGPYSCLGLPLSAPREVCRKRFLQLALCLHPDKTQHPDAVDAFQVLQAAFRTIDAGT